ncbi:MAG: hypothetical protein NZ959_01950 [Armatimonadetes bacterium]|nr:hypothetical protein [Armatimonadota bacterium]MDW8120823.1 glycoside hydrolase family 3 N-terminal domain-containing protein [Armatimonadota bacterium]
MGVWSEEQLQRMSVEEMVGQVILSGVGDRRKEVLQWVKEGKVGALIFYGKDMPDPESAAELANQFQEVSPLPVLITADFEAGTGYIVRGGTMLPTNMAIGATGSLEWARKCGEVTGVEARALGVHCAFAPVVDVNVNPENPIINVRSFGSDPEEVSRMAVAWIAGCQGKGCLATAKHFPGHGDTVEDSHRVLPVVPHGRDRMDQVELKPFRAAIGAGVAAVMTAHIYFPALEEEEGLPATLSYRCLTNLLKEEMGFKGVVFTDAMAMWAIKHNFEMGDAAVRAIQAGADVLLADDALVSYEAVLKAVRGGVISLERLRDAVRRVLEAKEWCALHQKRQVPVDKVREAVGSPAHQEVARQVAEASVTVVADDGLLPLADDAPVMAIVAESHRWTGEKASDELAQVIRSTFQRALVQIVPSEPSQEQVAQLVNEVTENPPASVLLCLFPRAEAYRPESSGAPATMVELAKRVSQTVPVCVASFGSPYPLVRFGAARAAVCTYSDCPASLTAGIKAIAGRIPFKGRLPVILASS